MNTNYEPKHNEEFDVVVIGAGPAGERGAAQAAYFGKKVALIEREHKPGGACVNTGTLPSKTFRETALHLSGLASRGIAGVTFDMKSTLAATQLRHRYAMVAHSEHRRIKANIEKHNIAYIHGQAQFADANTIIIKNQSGGVILHTIKAKHVLIATGSSPHHPPEIPFEDQLVMDSDTILAINSIPKSLIVVGAGVIGSEYASIFGALGVKVTLVDARDTLLPFLDSEISKVLKNEMQKIGVEFKFNSPIAKYEKEKKSVKVTFVDGTELEADALLYAIGRNGNTKKLCLDKVGITPDKRGALKVNEHYQTEVSNIYAVGDVIGFPALASTSMDQGRLAMCHAFGLTYRQRLPEHLPMGIYTIPEVSGVGETEESARSKGIDFEVGRAFLADNARAEIIGDTGGLVKIIFDVKTLAIIGVHVVCERASEVVTPGLFAVRLGAGIDFFIDTVFNYPTISEAYKYAAYDGLGRLAERGIETGNLILGAGH